MNDEWEESRDFVIDNWTSFNPHPSMNRF